MPGMCASFRLKPCTAKAVVAASQRQGAKTVEPGDHVDIKKLKVNWGFVITQYDPIHKDQR